MCGYMELTQDVLMKYIGTHQITASSKPVVDTVKVSAAISGSKVCKLLIRCFGK